MEITVEINSDGTLCRGYGIAETSICIADLLKSGDMESIYKAIALTRAMGKSIEVKVSGSVMFTAWKTLTSVTDKMEFFSTTVETNSRQWRRYFQSGFTEKEACQSLIGEFQTLYGWNWSHIRNNARKELVAEKKAKKEAKDLEAKEAKELALKSGELLLGEPMKMVPAEGKETNSPSEWLSKYAPESVKLYVKSLTENKSKDKDILEVLSINSKLKDATIEKLRNEIAELKETLAERERKIA